MENWWTASANRSGGVCPDGVASMRHATLPSISTAKERVGGGEWAAGGGPSWLVAAGMRCSSSVFAVSRSGELKAIKALSIWTEILSSPPLQCNSDDFRQVDVRMHLFEQLTECKPVLWTLDQQRLIYHWGSLSPPPMSPSPRHLQPLRRASRPARLHLDRLGKIL